MSDDNKDTPKQEFDEIKTPIQESDLVIAPNQDSGDDDSDSDPDDDGIQLMGRICVSFGLPASERERCPTCATTPHGSKCVTCRSLLLDRVSNNIPPQIRLANLARFSQRIVGEDMIQTSPPTIRTNIGPMPNTLSRRALQVMREMEENNPVEPNADGVVQPRQVRRVVEIVVNAVHDAVKPYNEEWRRNHRRRKSPFAERIIIRTLPDQDNASKCVNEDANQSLDGNHNLRRSKRRNIQEVKEKKAQGEILDQKQTLRRSNRIRQKTDNNTSYKPPPIKYQVRATRYDQPRNMEVQNQMLNLRRSKRKNQVSSMDLKNMTSKSFQPKIKKLTN